MAAQGAAEVEIEALTARTMLVPVDVFDPTGVDDDVRAQAGQALLAANGTPLAVEECAVWSAVADDLSAVMALDAETLRRIRETLGGRERFTAPLLCTPPKTMPTVWIYLAEGLLYTKVYDKGLRLAEVIPASTEADILYFMELLSGAFQLGKYELWIVAADPKRLRKLVGGYFKRVACEILK